MRYIIFIFLLTAGQALYAQNMEFILFEHNQRVEANPIVKLNFYEKVIATGLREFGKGKLNEPLINYLARHEQLIFKFKKSVSFANRSSKKLCQVNTRHTDDEVDALRHLLWAGFLSLNMGAEHALILTSLQEVRGGNNHKSMRMDLWNNYFAVETVELMRESLLKMRQEQQLSWMKRKFVQLVKEGKVKVVKTTQSVCQQAHLYPNLR